MGCGRAAAADAADPAGILIAREGARDACNRGLQALSHHNKPAGVTISTNTRQKLKAVSACQPKTLMLWSF
jgi:hypothetical protein